jgi:hypothetical protein
MTGLKIIWIGGLLLASTSSALQFGLVGLPAVELLSPADGSATCMTHPHFRWAEVAEADRYEIQIARDDAFRVVVDNDSIPVPRYVPLDPLAANAYWWRVRADYGSSKGSWSIARMLTTATIANPTTILTTDSVATVQSKIASTLNANPATPVRILFEQGTHVLDLPDGVNLFVLADKKDVIIEGAGTGATLLFRNSNSGFSQFDRCENILLRNFTIDYKDADGNPLLHTAGIVVSVDTANATFVFDPLPKYRAPSDPLIKDATGRRWGCIMDWTVPGRLKTGARNHFQFDESKTQDLGNGTCRLGLDIGYTADIGDFEPGDLFVKSASWSNMRLLFASASKNITYANCTFHAGNSNPFIGHNNDSVHFLRVRSILADGRYTSNPCGAFVGLNYKTGMWVEECETEGIFDDSVNQGIQPTIIQEKIADDTVRIWNKYMAQTYLEAGQQLTLFNPPDGTMRGPFTVLSVTLKTTPYRHREVKLNQPIGTVYPGTNFYNSQIYIHELSNPYAYVRNNTFRNSRRYGALFKSHGGVIEGNIFSGLSDPAIHVSNETINFPEGFNVQDVRILNNNIIDCGYSQAASRGAIEIWGNGFDGSNKFPSASIHSNVEIAGNIIHAIGNTCLHIGEVDGLHIHSNQFFAATLTNPVDVEDVVDTSGSINVSLWNNMATGQ